MPSTSRIVAQVKPGCPSSAWRRASAVDLCALTCGRSRAPGSAAAIVARLCSSAATSTSERGRLELGDPHAADPTPDAREGAAGAAPSQGLGVRGLLRPGYQEAPAMEPGTAHGALLVAYFVPVAVLSLSQKHLPEPLWAPRVTVSLVVVVVDAAR